MGIPSQSIPRLVIAAAAVALSFAVAGTARAARVQIGVKTTPAVEQVPGVGSGTWFAWAQGVPKHLLIQNGVGQPAIRVNPKHTQAWPGSIDGRTLVYQQTARDDSDIRFWDVMTHARSAPAGVNTPRWEWHPTMSGDWILFGRIRFRPHRSRVLLHNTSTNQTITLADVKGRSDPGQVSGDWAVWDQCVHRQCSVYRYDIAGDQTTKAPPTDVGKQQHYPSVTSPGTVYFAHSSTGCGRRVKLVEWVTGQPLHVLIAFHPGVEIPSTTQTIPDQVAGTDVYFDKHTCSVGSDDIFKTVVP